MKPSFPKLIPNNGGALRLSFLAMPIKVPSPPRVIIKSEVFVPHQLKKINFIWSFRKNFFILPFS